MKRAPGHPPRQSPYRRQLPSGRTVWTARFRADSRTRYAKPPWNGKKSSFALKSDAQRAIDEALDKLYGTGPIIPETIGGYRRVWFAKSHRSERTDKTNEARLRAVLGVELDGRPLEDWPFDELRRRHVNALVDYMLREQGRAVTGVRNILSTLSAMSEDAIEDELASANPFKGIRLRRNDKRAQKASREVRVWSFEEMRAFASGGRPEVRARHGYPPHDYEAMILAPGLLGVRLGELLALLRSDFDGEQIRVRGTAHKGRITGDTEEKRHDRIVPVSPSLAELIRRRPTRIDTDLLFSTPRGRVWSERNMYRDVWVPAQRATGLDPTPHEFRHSYCSHLRAAGIDPADLADVAGHTVETATSHYTHPLRQSYAEIRKVIG